MNRWTRKRKARGFTLVELLIVIVIIGILAGSMLLVFGSTTDSAKATRVVSELRSLKAAAMMYYADNSGWPTNISNLGAYMDRDPEEGEYCKYKISESSADYMTVASGDTGTAKMTGIWVKTEGLKADNQGIHEIFTTDGTSLTKKAREAGVGVNTNEIGMILEKIKTEPSE